MICDDARVQLLREIGGDGDSADARTHASECPSCTDYLRDAEAIWRASGRAVEPCPRRDSLLGGARPRRAPALAAAVLIAATVLVAWANWRSLRRTPAQDPDANAEELLKKDPEPKKQVLRTALEEKARLAEFEKKVAEAEKGFAEAKALYDAGKIKEAADRGGALGSSFPYLKVVVLDPIQTRYDSGLLRLRIREFTLIAQHKLLLDKPAPEDPVGVQERAEVEIRLINTLREIKRQIEELIARGPQPRKEPVGELGGTAFTLKTDTLDKIRSIRITIDMAETPFIEVVKYLREISGLNMVVGGPKALREANVALKLSDTILEALMDNLSKIAGYTWEVDRFGIVLFMPAKK